MSDAPIGDADLLALLDVDPTLLAHASDEELVSFYEALEELLGGNDEWSLQDRQLVAEAHATGGEVFEVLYGGAAGGGKSEWLLKHFYDQAVKYPGFSGLILRRTFPELRRSLILRSWARFDRSLARYVVGDHTWYFHNGSVIEFGYCEQDRDVFQYQSAEYDAIGFDELTQFPTDFCWTYLASRCRTSVRKSLMGIKPHMVAGTNPGGVGGLWVKTRWIDPAPWGEVFHDRIEVEGEEPREVGRVFVPAKLTDNRYVNATQYRIALANLGDKLRAQLEDGSWDVVEGQYFEEWDRDTHVCKPFEIPDWWERVCGYDFGFAKPAAHLWVAFSPDGTAYLYREMYGTNLSIRAQADRILLAERADPATGKAAERVALRIADPSIWTRTGAGPPIADQFADEGVYFRKANNARIDGWMRLRQYLEVDGDTGRPRLQVFSTCTNFIRTFPMLVHSETKPEDLNTHGEDHAADALRYLVMSRPPPSVAPKKPNVDINERGERLAMPGLTMKRRREQMNSSPLGRIR